MSRENTEKPRPYPTPTRLQLARDIAEGNIRHWAFEKPETRLLGNHLVTAAVAEFVNADPKLASYGTPDQHNYSVVSLTPAGEEWLTKYGSTE